MFRPTIQQRALGHLLLGELARAPRRPERVMQVPVLFRPVGIHPRHDGARLIDTTGGHDLLPAPERLKD